MTICHITSMHPYNDDRILERACKGLVEAGHKVKLIATYPGNGMECGVEIIGLKQRKGILRRIFSSFEAFWKARKTDSDVFHFHDPDLLPWMLLLAYSGRKVVYDVHENYESRAVKVPLPFFAKEFARRIYRKVENLFSSRFSGVTVVTDSMKELFNGVDKPIITTDNVVYVSRLKHLNISFQKNSNYIIYTSGTNSKARNCLQTIEALPIIIEEFPEVQMWFVGRYYPEEYKITLMEKASELNVKNNVKIEGMLSWEENFKRTATAHLGCVFYENNLNNKVTLPNRLYEYMYCGICVLGEEFPEVRKVLDDTGAGMCVDSSNPVSIADKAIYLLKNPDIMLDMGKKGRKAVLEKYNYENEIQKLDKFYKSIIQQ